MVTRRACRFSRSFSASFAKSSVIGWPVKRALAMIRRSAPSSSRTFERMRLATKKATSSGKTTPRRLRLADQDGHAGLELRRLDRHRKAPAEARFQPLFQARDLLRISIRSHDDLRLAFEQRVEGVEELFLRAVLVGEELDVVDEQRRKRRDTRS